MKKRRWWLLLLLVPLLLLAVAWWEPEGRLRGWLAGEPFHRGRPASAWGRAIANVRDPVRQLAASDELRQDSPEARAVLVQLLRHDDRPEVRWRAARLLQEGGKQSKEALPALFEGLDDRDPHVRRSVVRAIGGIDPTDPDAVAVLLPLLDGPLQLEVLRILQRSGPAARQGAARVAAIVHSQADPVNRSSAVHALRRLVGREATPTFLTALRDPHPEVRQTAVSALRQLKDDRPEVVAGLTRLLGDDVPGVRYTALGALERLGPAAASALPAVRKCEADPDPNVREAATRARRRISPGG